MALHDELLEQAQHLANREGKRPRQASLRRAVSSAYYALFHLLIAEAVSKWKIGTQRPQLARSFEHARMNAASARVKLFPFTGHDAAVVAHLKKIAATFSELYERRQMADYDLASLVKNRGPRTGRVGRGGVQERESYARPADYE